MPLSHGYGVVIGQLTSHQRDPINNFGQYYHITLRVGTPAGSYTCAVDVDSKMTNDGINWRSVPIGESDLQGVAAMGDGWHLLVSAPNTGALDNIRTPAFHRRGCTIIFVRYDPVVELLRRIFNALINPPWSSGQSVDALNVFEPILNSAQRVFVFGEPFTSGLGVHNIHQNQGAPAGSQWWAENGIWQDGATVIRRTDGSYVAFLTKFKTQAANTDSTGHPA